MTYIYTNSYPTMITVHYHTLLDGRVAEAKLGAKFEGSYVITEDLRRVGDARRCWIG